MFSEWEGTAWQGSEALRTLSAPLEDQIAALRRQRLVPAWKPMSIRQAMGVPSIFGIVSSIANTVGMLSLDAYRNGIRVAPADRPTLVIRPDPLRRPGSFFRDSAYNLASRGEAWWWVAKRDGDGLALSLLNIPPHEVTVEENPKDLRYPIIHWRDRLMHNDDVVQICYSREPGDLRGVGPLQMCGAAASVAVEAQEFAANFYGAGGYASTILQKQGPLDPTKRDPVTFEPDPSGFSEPDLLREQWMGQPNNVPRVIDDTLQVKQNPVDEHGAQMLTARDFQVGEVARMFNYPFSLAGFGVSGSSLTYSNVWAELDKLTRTCLQPHYLVKFEQAISDQLSRAVTARFDMAAFLRADASGRATIYTQLVPLGIITAEEARQAEGFDDQGNVDLAPQPYSPPSAVPARLPIQLMTEGGSRIAHGPAPLKGPEPIVTREQVRAMRDRLRAEGRHAGHGSIAKELNVSVSTVRRRLAA